MDITQKLRDTASPMTLTGYDCNTAADIIEALRTENDDQRKLFAVIGAIIPDPKISDPTPTDYKEACESIVVLIRKLARTTPVFSERE